MTRIFSGRQTESGARQAIAFGLAVLCAVSMFVVTAGPALALPPDAPTAVIATAGDASASVTWTAPASDGGFAIDSYTVTALPGGQAVTTPDGMTLSATVGDLTNGTPYTFTVTAHNIEPGVSAESAPSNAVTPAAPATVPDAPTIGTATGGPGQAMVNWSAPASDGGSPITGYTVTATPGGPVVTVDGSTLSATVEGLANGTAYTFTVHATNTVGVSAESAGSNAVTPATVPGTPTAVAASPGNASATIEWLPPADDGGAAVTTYTVSASSSAGAVPAPVTVAGSARSHTFSGLTNDATYTLAVVATNPAGTGAPTSRSVSPRTVTGSPTNVSVTPGNGSVTVTWSAPAGGSPVSSYTVTISGTGVLPPPVTVEAGILTVAVGGLTNGVPYTFRVSATNGAGTVSAPSVLAIPTAPVVVQAARVRSGYWMLEADGRVHPFGDARPLGDPRGQLGSGRAVDLEPTPSGNGYWIVDDLGRVYGYGDAVSRGDLAGMLAGERVTSLSATPSGDGYWIFTTRGRVVNSGDAGFFGEMSGVALNGPVLDSIPSASGNGYYMVASDGGIFAFGDVAGSFSGSMGGQRLNAPVQSLVPDPDGVGYWLVAADGGVFAFGAPFRGSMGATPLNDPVTGMVPSGSGYLMVGEDGGIFDFSGTPDGFKGSLGGSPPANPIVSVAVLRG